MSPEPSKPARCAEIDRPALARCSRLTRTQRVILGDLVSESSRQANERRELLGDVERAQAAQARVTPRLRLAPPAHCLAARGPLLEALALLDAGQGAQALERMRAAAVELKPRPAELPKVAGGSR